MINEQALNQRMDEKIPDTDPDNCTALAVRLAESARDQKWGSDDCADMLLMLGLEKSPIVDRALRSHGYEPQPVRVRRG